MFSLLILIFIYRLIFSNNRRQQSIINFYQILLATDLIINKKVDEISMSNKPIKLVNHWRQYLTPMIRLSDIKYILDFIKIFGKNYNIIK